jgi:hypothetical protein
MAVWVFEPSLTQAQAKSVRLWADTLLKPPCLEGGREVRAVFLIFIIHWHYPYNWRKIMEKVSQDIREVPS